MSEQSSPRVIGHRGASGYRPEHTSAAYALAFALGADSVEPDIVATSDGVLVLRHENEISTTTDVAERLEFAERRTTKSIDGNRVSGWFTEDFTWAELSTLRARERLPLLRQGSSTFDDRFPILRLRDLLELVDRAQEGSDRLLGIVAEIKHASYFASIELPLAELFEAELKEAGWWDAPGLVVESFERSVLGELHERGFRRPRIYLVEASGAPADRVARDGSAAMSYAEELSDEGLTALAAAREAVDRVEGVSVPTELVLTPSGEGDAERATALVERFHGLGLAAYCWTLRPENHFLTPPFRGAGGDEAWGRWHDSAALLMGAGFDAVFADHPDLAVEVREGLAASVV